MEMMLSCHLLSTLWLQQIRQMWLQQIRQIRLQHITSAASIRAVRVFLYTSKRLIMGSSCLFRGDAHEGNDSRENLLCTYSPQDIMFNRSKSLVHASSAPLMRRGTWCMPQADLYLTKCT